MKRSYHTIDKQGKANEKKLAEFLSKGGQLLLPMVDLIEQCQMAYDELIDVAGRAAIQAMLGYRRSRWPGHASRASSELGRWSGMASNPGR